MLPSLIALIAWHAMTSGSLSWWSRRKLFGRKSTNVTKRWGREKFISSSCTSLSFWVFFFFLFFKPYSTFYILVGARLFLGQNRLSFFSTNHNYPPFTVFFDRCSLFLRILRWGFLIELDNYKLKGPELDQAFPLLKNQSWRRSL